MITDERTRNRLYADTETTLFTLEDKPGGNITDNGNHKGHPRICATFAPSSGICGRRPAGRMVVGQGTGLPSGGTAACTSTIYTGRIHTGTDNRENACFRIYKPGI